MDGNLKKELKKLEHDYSYEDTVRIALSRNHSGNRISEELAKKVHFDLDGSLPEYKQPPLLRRMFRKFVSQLDSLRMLLADWVFLALLGFVVAILSILVDNMIYYMQSIQESAVSISSSSSPWWSTVLSFIACSAYTTGLVAASASFVHYVSPQAIGSGIPEMKTIIRGVVLKDYLSFRTLVSKVFGVAMSLGSGVPIGKMGPFVHIASVVANRMSLLASRFDPSFRSETRRVECLAAACAVGVACTFSAPVGGVLFSIEVTTMYFSVRSYWRGFFASCCGATTIRLLRGFLAQTEVSVNAFFQTSFAPDAFSVGELPLFVLLGLICGILGAAYICLYRNVVLFLRNNTYAKKIFQQHWIVYPLFISMLFNIVSFRHGLGIFTSGRTRFGLNLRDFFSNCSFTAPHGSLLSCGEDIFEHWIIDRGNILLLLLVFILVHIVFSILCITLPVPSGIFMPVFVLGAAIGRLMGEIISLTLPDGGNIHPGVYAVVGAAAFSASVTHTVSVSVMIFEITGQLHFILPVMISVVISNAVCAYLQPSFFDTIIKIKHLPFLPDIPPSNHIVHTTFAEHIMTSPVLFATRMTSFGAIRNLLIDGRNLRIFPVVDKEDSQMLIGTISRRFMLERLEVQVGDVARRSEAERRVRLAIATIDEHFQNSQIEAFPRTLSDSNLTTDSRRQRRDSQRIDDVSEGIRTSRFLVVPSSTGDFHHVIPPPPPSQRRNSLNRRNAFCSTQIQQKAYEADSDLHSVHSSAEDKHHSSFHSHSYHTLVRNCLRQAKKYLHSMQFGHTRKGDNVIHAYDLTPEERVDWEVERLSEVFEFTEDDIDPAPFQLVKRTSLYKIHSIFSMLQLNKAYVTDCGRLTGVVALSDVRRELEKSQAEREVSIKKPKTILRQGAMRKKTSSSKVFDILTPTLEVIRPTALQGLEESRPVETEMPLTPPPVAPERKASSLRVPSHRLSPDLFSQRSRGSLCDTPHEQLVEAVAYLRRKSLAAPERRTYEEETMIERRQEGNL